MTLCDHTHFRIFFLALVSVTLQTHALDVCTFDQDLLLFSFDFDWKQLNNAQSKISDLKEQ